MTSPAKKRERGAKLRNRIAAASGSFAACVVLDCNQQTTARAGRGLNRHYCQRHVEHYRRHGSYAKASYRAHELRPHRQAARAWLRAHRNSPEVCAAAANVVALYERGGQPEEAFRLSGKPPEERARKIWAKLRQKGIEPTRVLEVWAAIELCHSKDARPERKREFRWVQAAKLLHRMAGGSHKSWSVDVGRGRTRATSLHAHPASRGRVLLHLGKALDGVAMKLRSALLDVHP